MKKIIILLIISCMSLVLPTSCLKEYLDKAPEQGLSEEIIFTKYDNFRAFFDAVYFGHKGTQDFNIKAGFPLYWDMWDQKYALASVTDASDNGRYMEGHAWKSGNMSETIVNKMTYDGARNPVLESMFTCIRISNIALRKVSLIQDADDNAKNDLRGQAYFIRALGHLYLMNFWGPMPYLDKPLGPTDQWDIPRLSKHECLTRIAGDFDSAYICFKLADKVRRDPGFDGSGTALPNHGVYGSYNAKDGNQLYRPNGMAALGFKSRALLYRASPLNTEGDPNDWKEAAAAAWDAIKVALEQKVILLPNLTERNKNYVGAMVCDESLWTYSYGNLNWDGGNQSGTTNRGIGATMWNGAFGASTSWSGVCPTQNYVDKYETRWGDPLNTAADRAAATTAGHYNEQDPYNNRDPRFAWDVMYNQSPAQNYASNKAQIYYTNVGGTITPAELFTKKTYPGMTYTGYYLRKFWNNNSTLNKVTGILTDPLCRLAEMYLNYAEASNEAYGPSAIGVAGANLSAVDAINAIRARATMPNVLAAYTGSTVVFRDRIKNERNIELAYEGHHYYNDIHRWMDLQGIMSSTVMGMDIEKVTVSATYPTGFKHVRLPLPAERQTVWKPQMYYLPFNNSDNLKMKNFVPNPVW